MEEREQERVRQMREDHEFGNRAATRMKWDPHSKRIIAGQSRDPDSRELDITPSDMDHFAPVPGADVSEGVIVVTDRDIQELGHGHPTVPLRFRCVDGGSVYSTLGVQQISDRVSGQAFLVPDHRSIDVAALGSSQEKVRVILSARPSQGAPVAGKPDLGLWHGRGFVYHAEQWVERSLQIVPLGDELSSRTRGIFETALLADACVLVAGLGSGGAPITLESAKVNIGTLILVDDDRLEVANIWRHPAGLSQVGRFKTDVVAEMVTEKNPDVRVETVRERISWATLGRFRDLVRRADLVICGIDDREGRLVLNRACVAEGRTMLVAGTFRRAYGGQILRVRPGKSPCYQCFVKNLPQDAADQEISSARQANRLAYSDRPVVIEPGLANDIAPISQMVVKLALQELLQGKSTTLRSLDEDLDAPWYLWLNRRETGTCFEKLAPLQSAIDGMRVMRWYGIDLERDEACPACGSFVDRQAAAEGIDLTAMDMEAFAATGGAS